MTKFGHAACAVEGPGSASMKAGLLGVGAPAGGAQWRGRRPRTSGMAQLQAWVGAYALPALRLRLVVIARGLLALAVAGLGLLLRGLRGRLGRARGGTVGVVSCGDGLHGDRLTLWDQAADVL